MTTADKALIDRSICAFALRSTEFSDCVIFDFADGSFLVVRDNGRVEANQINA